MFAWMLLVLGTIPHEVAVREQVDIVERNFYHDCEGKLIFVQLLFWEWQCTGHVITAWRLEKPEFSVTERPPQVTWYDGDKLRQVRGESWRETHYQWDEEIAQREKLPQELRKGLSK